MTEFSEKERLMALMIEAKKEDPETGSFTEFCADFFVENGVTVPVRCRDCVRWEAISDACGNCYLTTTVMRPDDYCSRGKRREKDGS